METDEERIAQVFGIGIGDFKRRREPPPVLPWDELPKAYCLKCGRQATYWITTGAACDDHVRSLCDELLDERGGCYSQGVRMPWSAWILYHCPGIRVLGNTWITVQNCHRGWIYRWYCWRYR